MCRSCITMASRMSPCQMTSRVFVPSWNGCPICQRCSILPPAPAPWSLEPGRLCYQVHLPNVWKGREYVTLKSCLGLIFLFSSLLPSLMPSPVLTVICFFFFYFFWWLCTEAVCLSCRKRWHCLSSKEVTWTTENPQALHSGWIWFLASFS